jgi:hypothetical protein
MKQLPRERGSTDRAAIAITVLWIGGGIVALHYADSGGSYPVHPTNDPNDRVN